jgi:lipopolysaccharide/colanic/teichoic acid biosynthesis glycosyltransferase
MPYIEQDKVDEKTRKKLEAIIEKSYLTFWRQKRLFDIFFATLILLFFVPLMIVIAIVIVIDDPSASPFYKQIRVGRHGKEFYMYKFRTMRANADKMLEELVNKNEMDGPAFKMKEDPRIIRVGKFLRKVSLDELMQFFNVLKGDMSLVGTRPPTEDEFEQYSNYYRRRMSITPRLTGMWQVKGRGVVTEFEDVVKMDLDYIDHWSLTLDIKILFQTVGVVLFGRGSK